MPRLRRSGSVLTSEDQSRKPDQTIIGNGGPVSVLPFVVFQKKTAARCSYFFLDG